MGWGPRFQDTAWQGLGAQVWKNCWSTWVLRVPLVLSVWLTNSWVMCRVREPSASRRWDPRVSPSIEEEVLKDPAWALLHFLG